MIIVIEQIHDLQKIMTILFPNSINFPIEMAIFRIEKKIAQKKQNYFYYQKDKKILGIKMHEDKLASKQKNIIGQGSFGKVYKYQYNNQFYAIKKIFKDTKNHPQLIQKIQSQGRLMEKVNHHRNIVGYMGQTTCGKFLYLLTEYIPDGDLRRIDFLPTEDDLWQIIMQLSMALNHLKKNKIIHRDIKPQNILIKKTHQPTSIPQTILKLTDFGLAQQLLTNNYIQGIAGSPVYLAPQMCKFQYYSYQIDIWSLGITLYQLSHHQKNPYHDQILHFMTINQFKHTQKSLFCFLMKLIQSKIIKCSSPYPLINQLIQSMLNHNPKARPTPLEILQHPKVMEKVKRYSKNIKNNLFETKVANKKRCSIDQISKQKIETNNRNNNNNNNNNNNKQLISSQSLQLFLSSRISNSFINSISNNSISILENQLQSVFNLEINTQSS